MDIWNDDEAGSTLNWTLLEDGGISWVHATFGSQDTDSSPYINSGDSIDSTDIDTVTVALVGTGGTDRLSDGTHTATLIITDPSAIINPRTVDLTLVVNPAGSISGYVWEDTDGDGVWDAGENAYTGSSLQLTRDGSDGGATVNTQTGDGSYTFGDIVPLGEGITVTLDTLPSGPNWNVSHSTVRDLPGGTAARCSSNPTCLTALSITLPDKEINFGIWEIVDAWFQVIDGDIHSNEDIYNPVPSD